MRRYSDNSFDSDGSTEVTTDMECGPCGASRLSLAATWVCSTCKESFCNNCVKIHKLKKSSRNHQLFSIKTKIGDDIDNDYDDKSSDTSKYSPKRASIVEETMHAMRQKAQDRKSEMFDRPRDQLQYMKALEKRHDHFNEDLDNEYYCEKHKEVMCILCKEVKHKNCKTFKPVEDVAEIMKSSSDTHEMVQTLSKLLRFANLMHEDRETERRKLKLHKEDLQSYIMMIQEEREQMDLELEDCEDIEERHKENMYYIDKEKEVCQKIMWAAKKDGNDLSKIFESENPSFVVKTVLKIQQKVPVYTKMLQETYDSARNHNYIHFEDDVDDEEHSLGTVRQTDANWRLPPFLVIEDIPDQRSSRASDSSMLRSKTILAFKSQQCGQNFGVTGLSMSKNGDIMMVDRQQSLVSIVNEKRCLYCTYECESLPWDITSIGNDFIAVTIPGEKLVTILQVKDNEQNVSKSSKDNNERDVRNNFKIEKMSDIVCQDECFGIDFSKGKLYVTFNAWMDDPHVGFYELNSNQQVLGSPSLTLLPLYSLIAPQHIACDDSGTHVFISDCGTHGVVYYDNMRGKVGMVYYSKDLVCPTGITLDRESNVYVCCRDSETVHKLSSDGSSGDIVLTAEDGIEKPRGICFDKMTEKLLVASKTKSKIREYAV